MKSQLESLRAKQGNASQQQRHLVWQQHAWEIRARALPARIPRQLPLLCFQRLVFSGLCGIRDIWGEIGHTQRNPATEREQRVFTLDSGRRWGLWQMCFQACDMMRWQANSRRRDMQSLLACVLDVSWVWSRCCVTFSPSRIIFKGMICNEGSLLCSNQGRRSCSIAWSLFKSPFNFPEMMLRWHVLHFVSNTSSLLSRKCGNSSSNLWKLGVLVATCDVGEPLCSWQTNW